MKALNHRRRRQTLVQLGVVSLIAAIASTGLAQRRRDGSSAPVHRFTVDYFNFGGNGVFQSKQRIVGDYRKNADGTVEWSNVSTSTAQTIDGAFGSGDAQSFMNGFRYRPGSDTSKADFFKGFPPNATSHQNMVWDTQMFEQFAQQLPKLGGAGTPYRLPPSDVPLAVAGTFQNTNIELTRAGVIERNGQRLAVLHYDAFFNKFELNLSSGMKMAGRSDYWGDIWVVPASNAVERSTLFEEVLGELSLPSQPNPLMINVVRRGLFERVSQ